MALSEAENKEEAMRSAAEMMTERVVKTKEEGLLRTQQGNAGGSAGGNRKKVDVEPADPRNMASRAAGRVRSGGATIRQDEMMEADWKNQPVKNALLASLDEMEKDEALEFLASNGCKAAEDILREMDYLRAKAAVGASLERAIKAAEKHNETEEGHRT